MVKVYTKRGDGGSSSLYNGTVLSKTSLYFEALGSVDELSSHVGHLIVLLEHHAELRVFQSSLKTVLTRLMDMGSSIATPDGRNYNKTRFESHEHEVEQWIDFLDTMLPRLTNFILPGGTEPAAVAHICRSVCRRAERSVLNVTPRVDVTIPIYLNRLSDFFFTLARYINMVLQVPDVIYCASKSAEKNTTPSTATSSVALRFCPQEDDSGASGASAASAASAAPGASAAPAAPGTSAAPGASAAPSTTSGVDFFLGSHSQGSER